VHRGDVQAGSTIVTAVDVTTSPPYTSVQDQVIYNLDYGFQTKNGNYAVRTDPFAFGSDFTFELIFRFTEKGSNQTLLTFGDESIESSLIVSRIGDDNKLQVELKGGPGSPDYSAAMTVDNDLLDSNSNPNHSEYVHLVVTYQSPTPPSPDSPLGTPPNLSIYINEQKQTVSQAPVGGSSFNGIPTQTRSFHLMGNSNLGTGNERIKSLRFYQEVKTQDEVILMLQDVQTHTPLLSTGWTPAVIQQFNQSIGGDSNNQPVTATGAPLSLIPKNLLSL